MGKRILFFLLLAGCSFSAKSQTAPSAKSRTFAVIVGISQYQSKIIPPLNYADKDATVFADWLKSKAGGSVPDYRIRLLTNTEATVAAIYYALDWLSDEAQQNDIVYLYFSGHGDVEIDSASISRGYLLAYNSPPNNYANNAIKIEDINNIANSLTIKNQAKVILITDACHSGKLAGDNYKGKQLTAHNLRAVLNNQVRIASCAEDEEAAEGPAWGGGRGVFSYYLLNGLNGMADLQKNDTVKLNELGIFLDSALLTDKDLIRAKHKQHPVTDGLGIFPLAVVDKETLLALK